MNIDTSLIYEGLTVKNYKSMCELICQPIKSGKSKIIQMDEWQNFFSYEKDGHKLIIKEIYAKPKVKQTKRFGLVNQIEELILDMLVRDKHDGLIFLSKHRLFYELKMINENYTFGRYNMPKLSVFLGMETGLVEEFYKLSSKTLMRNVEKSLNNLKNKSLVFWQPAKTVCIIDSEFVENEKGSVKLDMIYEGQNEYEEDIYDFKPVHTVKHIHREATEAEIKIIIATEREALESLHCESKQDLFKYNAINKFNKIMKHQLFEKMNILYYYDSYKIIFNEEHIQQVRNELMNFELTESERIKKLTEINLNTQNRLTLNAENRNKKASQKETVNIKYIRRSEDTYNSDNGILVDTLINHNYKNIRKEVRSIKLKSD